MALTGLEIYKLLPKTNCGECSSPTCLAFAMRLASKKASLDECPHVSEEAKAAMGAASAPPIRLITIGAGENKVEIGNETVLFRHDETFYHPPGLAVTVDDDLDPSALSSTLEKIDKLKFERVGQSIGVNLILVRGRSKNSDQYKQVVAKVLEGSSLPLILMDDNPVAIAAALEICAGREPLIYAADKNNWEEMAKLAKEKKCPLTIKGDNLDDLADLVQKIVAQGVEDIILDSGSRETLSVLNDLTQIRRLALKRTFRPFGYPVITFPTADDPYQEAAQASTYIAKYAGIVVLKGVSPWEVLPLLTLRQNIYTDPQKPIQVEAKLYEVGNVDNNSPLLVTTNFSLTYFTVEGDVEASRIPSYIAVVDTEGTSVLTAWASEKFTSDTIAAAVKKYDMENIINHRRLIIPGYVSVLSGKLEEGLPGWEIMVGPRESSAIPSYLKSAWQK